MLETLGQRALYKYTENLQKMRTKSLESKLRIFYLDKNRGSL